MNNAMTIDVEDYFQVAAFADQISTTQWSKMESRVERNTHKILELFEKNNIRATFFVLGWVAERYPNIVTEISSRGHEIACHGYSHQLIYNQDQKDFYSETLKAKDILEDIINKKVIGYRAASYSITRQSLWALDVLTDLGFEYDSSIVPVRHDLYGIPGMPRNPHSLKAPNSKTLIEFPPTTLSIFGNNIPVAGGGYFRLYPYWFSKLSFKWINNSEKMPVIFYLHPWEVDPDQPKMEGKWFSKFRHYNNLTKCESRLDTLLKDFSFTTVKDVLVALNMYPASTVNESEIVAL